MKKKINLFVYYVFLIIIIVSFSYMNSLHSTTESFIPLINAYSKPLERKARYFAENFQSKANNTMEKLYKKFGLK